MDRSHETRYAGRTSEISHINASVVQGSGFGPSNFDVVASDLHPLHQTNSIVKYADDTYLIVPAFARSTVSSELEHISGTWWRLLGRGGALVETMTFNQRVVGSTPALVARAARFEILHL